MHDMPKRILVVEDNADNREILIAELEFQDYQVHYAGDGQEAILRAVELLPDLILMDMSLPNIDGLEATRRIKAHPQTAHIPIVALTAHAMRDDEARFRNAGCDDYLAKPIDPEQVTETIERVLRERASGTEDA